MPRIICILGMHRSGTSCLAGSLQEAGLHLGDVVTAARHNLKGNRESPRIWQLHDAVLLHSGGTWSQPPVQVTWSDTHRTERDAIIRSYADRPAWGFKDPRTLLLLDFWREAVTDLVFVGTFRHPHLVAESLYRREGGQVAQWRELWAHYNARLLGLHDAAPFPVLRFDIAEQDYRRSIALVTHVLGLQPPSRSAFFDPELRHNPDLRSPVALEDASLLYQSLCRIALDPGAACA